MFICENSGPLIVSTGTGLPLSSILSTLVFCVYCLHNDNFPAVQSETRINNKYKKN
jgi:hypothetical protein